MVRLMVAALVVGLGLSGYAWAQRKDCGELKGEIAEETSDHVVLRMGAGTITIARRDITRIVHDTEADHRHEIQHRSMDQARVTAEGPRRRGR